MGGRQRRELMISHCGNTSGTNKLPPMGAKLLKKIRNSVFILEVVLSRKMGVYFQIMPANEERMGAKIKDQNMTF